MGITVDAATGATLTIRSYIHAHRATTLLPLPPILFGISD